jgi:hypothetical protein
MINRFCSSFVKNIVLNSICHSTIKSAVPLFVQVMELGCFLL